MLQRHDEGVPVVVVILVAGLLLLVAPVRPPAQGTRGRTRRWRLPRSSGWALAAVVLLVLLVRFGLEWLALAGGILLAVLRSAGTLAQLLPLLRELRGQSAGAGAGGTHAGGASAGGASAGYEAPGGGRRAARMSRREALEVLGLDANATPEDVQREYRRLIKKIHPDLGGSTYLAAKVNEAKDVLS